MDQIPCVSRLDLVMKGQVRLDETRFSCLSLNNMRVMHLLGVLSIIYPDPEYALPCTNGYHW